MTQNFAIGSSGMDVVEQLYSMDSAALIQSTVFEMLAGLSNIVGLSRALPSALIAGEIV